jgi:hypothetical protein
VVDATPTVDELQVDVPADLGHRGGPAGVQLGRRACLDRPDDPAGHRFAGRCVAEPGDLRLVRHDADQPEPGPAGDRGGEATGVGRGVDR